MKKNSLLYIVRNSKVHGKGVFARKDIPKGTKIIEYVGNIVSSKEGLRIYEEQLKKSKETGVGAVYIFQLNRKQDIDGDVPWNPAKYINHSCNPNCKYKIINNHIWIFSIRDIKKGEELNYDYDYDLDNYQDHLCKCNSKDCLGFIIGKRYRKKFKKLMKINLNIYKVYIH
ncbi:MAG TPA: SET domain-containing protein-lysine N-methyltransferase [Candidatus Pacearchaeota archaeon]|nr:SET domain-containing protein-lysine N-methyltransferase [Candidatus Pacearchaeota archaeon]HOH04469.1 SET domain-containing protein-lysine N-methyltransferase [Candidatus Pacearchaeota archaeon]HOU79498.1 SET domain-containing protein-lysine N-methyltransferase [Candidatus Pacearchaeota archaeon]HPJ87074.1 SET domain-containing protein-lysine N-methyltransferase [Candidatus Pacearchaeota archaeon]HPX74884.1 SET domain-containing protein-lysine N-methyltransferase [Candidatus Pacearchaeota a